MLDVVLVTTILISMPEKDFHSTIFQDKESIIECEYDLEKAKDVYMNLGPVTVEVFSECLQSGEL
jgi:hypothetical protein